MGKINLDKWDVEDNSFWESTGKKIATKNLWISIPALLLAFAVWILWSIIATKLKEYGFNFGMITPEMRMLDKMKVLAEIEEEIPSIKQA